MSDTLIQWDVIQKRYDELKIKSIQLRLKVANGISSKKNCPIFLPCLAKHREIMRLEAEQKALMTQKQENTDPELAQLYEEELTLIDAALLKEKSALDKIMFPADPLDNRSAFLEIRAGTGGQEASLFAADLLRMYTNYALKQGWKVAVVSTSETDLGGIREVVLHIEGKDVYGHLKYESGVHRVQRVPVTEASGRIHTSTATVAVLPEAEEVDVAINPSDLTNRCVSLKRCGWSARKYDRLCRAYYSYSNGGSGYLPGRAIPA